ncbi:hypothetical protein JKP88DRAFT_243237 [Tribonema minus]|uniref:Uncharacterized protein n=1 Tax=Tribonema minus TaxID=303371 RepID=A0A835Z8L0_9STRA|nr:hypothetical protein JKP88DRAFT_243237 [Tribonema minus]
MASVGGSGGVEEIIDEEEVNAGAAAGAQGPAAPADPKKLAATKRRLVDDAAKWKRHKPVNASAPIWDVGEGFSIYRSKAAEVQDIVVCETCVSKQDFRHAEFS